MPTRRPDALEAIFDEHAVLTERQAEGAGVKKVMVRRGLTQMGAVRTATAMNQRHGFDRPGCAWRKSNTPVSEAVVMRLEPWVG